jgi:hypothetical protein
MRVHRLLLCLLAVCGLGGGEAKAHFLFVRIGPVAEGGRSAEVYFSEQAEAGDPRFIDKIAHTQLWVQAKPGEFQPLTVRKAADRLRAPLPASGSVAVVGVCEYGVLDRPGQPSFLLRHYPKAIAGNPDELNRMAPRAEIPLEIKATIEGERVRLVALRQGKPVPGAVFHAVDSDLSPSKVTADSDGVADWTPPATGRYSVYTRETIKQPGEFRGKHHDEVLEFATIAFAWPLERKGADPEAVTLFEGALATRAQWKDFPGFSAEIGGEVDGRPFAGKVTVQADGTVGAETDDPVAKPWVQDQLESLAMHRLAEADGGSSEGRRKPVLRFADDQEDHPLGRLLAFEGGRFASSYRIKDGQIAVVNRHIGRQDMTITVLDNQRNPEGKFLPHSYSVHYWDTATGALNRVETIQERWQRSGSFDLPALHTVTTSSDGGLSVRSVTLSEHRLLGSR